MTNLEYYIALNNISDQLAFLRTMPNFDSYTENNLLAIDLTEWLQKENKTQSKLVCLNKPQCVEELLTEKELTEYCKNHHSPMTEAYKENLKK